LKAPEGRKICAYFRASTLAGGNSSRRGRRDALAHPCRQKNGALHSPLAQEKPFHSGFYRGEASELRLTGRGGTTLFPGHRAWLPEKGGAADGDTDLEPQNLFPCNIPAHGKKKERDGRREKGNYQLGPWGDELISRSIFKCPKGRRKSLSKIKREKSDRYVWYTSRTRYLP